MIHTSRKKLFPSVQSAPTQKARLTCSHVSSSSSSSSVGQCAHPPTIGEHRSEQTTQTTTTRSEQTTQATTTTSEQDGGTHSYYRPFGNSGASPSMDRSRIFAGKRGKGSGWGGGGGKANKISIPCEFGLVFLPSSFLSLAKALKSSNQSRLLLLYLCHLLPLRPLGTEGRGRERRSILSPHMEKGERGERESIEFPHI